MMVVMGKDFPVGSLQGQSEPEGSKGFEGPNSVNAGTGCSKMTCPRTEVAVKRAIKATVKRCGENIVGVMLRRITKTEKMCSQKFGGVFVDIPKIYQSNKGEIKGVKEGEERRIAKSTGS